MRVLIASHQRYFPDHSGGAAAAIRDRCGQLRPLGVETLVLCRGEGGETLEDDWEDQPLVRAPDPAAALGRCAGSFAPDVVMIEMGGGGALGAAALGAGLPIVLFQHDLGLDGRLVHAGAPLLAASKFLAARVGRLVGRPVAAVGSIVDRDRYARPERPSGTTVLFVNPIPTKGLYIARDIARAMPATRFRFRESWPLPGPAWRDVAAGVGRLPNVELLHATHSTAELYGDIGALLVPSIAEEGWGRVVTEAQAAGVPVLASDRGGLPEATGTGGIVLPLHAPTGRWVDALGLLLGPERGVWSAAARARAFAPDVDPTALAGRLLERLQAAARR
ncbi:MAG: glycosyltransferase [Alphaproteobacteria bacterium]